MARKTQLVEKLRLKNYKKLDTNPNITIIDGTARFISDHKVEVQRADGVLVLEMCIRDSVHPGVRTA